MKLFNLFRLGLILSSGLLLAACSQPLPRVHPMPAKDVPQKNPQPKYFLTVRGHIAPSLIGKVKVAWYVIYYTLNQHCWQVTNQFEGVSSPHSKMLTIVSHPNSAGYFRNQLPLDYFLPGVCRWRVEFIAYDVGNLTDLTLATFSKPYGHYKFHATQNFKCKKDQCTALGGSFLSGFNMNLPLIQGFVFNLNINGDRK